MKEYLPAICPAGAFRGSAMQVLHRSLATLRNGKTRRIETAQEWLGHTSTAHTRAYIDAEDYRARAKGVAAALDIQAKSEDERGGSISWDRRT